MTGETVRAVHPTSGAASGAQAQYAPIDAPEGTQAQSSMLRKSAMLLTGLGVAAAAAVACAPGSGLLANPRGFMGAAAAGERTCVVMAGVRLDNGAGDYSDATVKTPDDCTAKCTANAKCAQYIYSAENGGCYMFGEPNPKQFTKDDGSDVADFHSAFCGESRLTLQVLHRQALQSQEGNALREVREKWVLAETKARKIVDGMTLEDKMAFVSGSDGGLGYAGFLKVRGLPQVGDQDVMNLKMQDGPQGFNPYQEVLAGTATQFPALLSVAASFSPEVARRYAEAVADEFVTKGANVLLGPDVEVTRATMSGRCFETLSGEDPFLGSQLVKPYVQMVQARGIIATVKHWLDNNQEINRNTMNSVVSERANHEIYMPVFKAAFEAGASAVMCAYNNVNGHHACESEHLLTQLLRKELGFKGYAISDWGATHNAAKSVNTGLDVEMPNAKHMKAIPELIKNGTVREETIDTMVTHVISAMQYVGHFEGRFPLDRSQALGHLPATTDEHREVAFKTLVEATVLLKNDGGTLPIQTAGKKIALIGKYCKQTKDKLFSQGDVFAGGGSGYVLTNRTITPLAGLTQHVLDAAELVHSSDASAGAGADIAIVCASAHAEEGWDRKDLLLPEAEDLVAALRKLPGGQQQKIVVLAVVPGAVTTEWIKEADAALMMFGPGEQVGRALAHLLTGEASPKGRLPVSLPEVGEKRFTPYQYPGLCADDQWCDDLIANFSEDTLVGYRWNEAKKVPSAFPFGFGLTYTAFEFKDLQASCSKGLASVTLKVSNTGARKGTAVPQLYVGFPSLAPVVRQLRGFQKIDLAAGDEEDVVFTLQESDWSTYDEKNGSWVSAAARGEEITVTVATSAADTALSAKMSCTEQTITEVMK